MTLIDFASEKRKRENKRYPTLYGKASTGKIKLWKIRVRKNRDGTADVVTEHGYEDSEELQEAIVKIVAGKNIGRSNETTPFEQACSEAESKWKKKQDKKYVQTRSDLKKVDDSPYPMLAHEFQKRGKDIKWPAYVQPKLNGVRCLSRKMDEKTIRYTSREGKLFTTLEHLTPHLLKVMEVGETLDGEVFSRKMTFQEISSAVKKLQQASARLELWVYDIIKIGTFEMRHAYLNKMGLTGPLVPVVTILIGHEAGMKKLHIQFVTNFYEGTIIRSKTGTYKSGPSRSVGLQKFKDHEDKEFKIIGGKQGIGKDEGAVIFLCVQEEGKKFDCRPCGSYEQRRAWWENLPELIGKPLTVRFNGRSDDNIPLFVRGMAIRDYE